MKITSGQVSDGHQGTALLKRSLGRRRRSNSKPCIGPVWIHIIPPQHVLARGGVKNGGRPKERAGRSLRPWKSIPLKDPRAAAQIPTGVDAYVVVLPKAAAVRRIAAGHVWCLCGVGEGVGGWVGGWVGVKRVGWKTSTSPKPFLALLFAALGLRLFTPTPQTLT